MLIYIVFTTTTDWALVLFYMEQTSHPGRPTTFLRSCHTTQHRRKSNTGAQLCSAHLMGRAAGQACTAHPTTELGSTSHSTHPHSISFTDLMSSTSPYSDSAASVFLHFYCTQFFPLLFSQSFTCCIPQFTWFYTPPPTLYTHPQPALVGAWGGWGSRWQRTGVASPVFFFFFPPCWQELPKRHTKATFSETTSLGTNAAAHLLSNRVPAKLIPSLTLRYAVTFGS